MSSYPPPGSVPPGGPPNPFAPNPFSPQPIPALGTPRPYVPTRTSKLAVLSLLSAIFSPVFFCMCIPSLLMAIAGVVGGHVALYRINRSEGRLTGFGAAVAALVVGYPLLLLGLIATPTYISAFMKAANEDRADVEQSPFDAAESQIVSASNGTAHGNSPEAIELAEQFSESLKTARDMLITKRERPGVSLSRGEFLTYCQLSPGKCAFLVHVPDYRKFDDEAKELLAGLAWITAQSTVEGTLEEGDELAVGLKGIVMYGSVQVGTVVADADEETGIEYQGEDKDQLEPFFEPPPSPVVEPEPEPEAAPEVSGEIKLDPLPEEEKTAEGNQNDEGAK